MASLVICFLMFQAVAGNEKYRGDSILHHLNSGIKFAKEFLETFLFEACCRKKVLNIHEIEKFIIGSESVALKVADFVVHAFQPTSNKNNRPTHDVSNDYSNENNSEENKHNDNIHEVPHTGTVSPLRHLVQLLGLQPRQISAVAVNALIFVAQMITSFLAGPRRASKSHRSEDFTQWIVNKNSQKLQNILTTARNDSLPHMIEDLILEQESEEETSCIRLLLCKITPFVNKMQDAVFGENTDDNNFTQGTSFLYRHLPTNDEFNSKSKICEQKYNDCKLYE